jgi:hypothetical protein
MSSPTTLPMQMPPRRRRRWWRIALGFLALAVVVVVGILIYSRLAMQNAWDAAVAEADSDLPRWRLMEMEADQPALPDNENSALHIITVIPMVRPFSIGNSPKDEAIFEKLPQTARLNHQQEKRIRDELGKFTNGVVKARKLKDMPRGRFPVTYSDDYNSTLIPNHQDTRLVGNVLRYDAFLLAHDGKCDEAVESCHAILNAGRAMEDGPLLISLLIRIALNSIVTDTLERVLAQGSASEEALRIMQAALEQESKDSMWLAAMRGERAGQHYLFDNMRAGKVKVSNLGGMARGGGPASVGEWLTDAFPSVMLRYYPEHLRYLNRTVETAKLPIHERVAKMQELEAEVKGTKNVLTRLQAPALSKVHQSECRSQAMLRSAAAGLACERYWMRHKAWPASLDMLVKEKLLAAVPLDPIDGQPLRYRQTKDGIVIYSIGLDKTDNDGNIDREHPANEGVDIGFRLWNKRRLEPPPPVAEPETGGPPR